MCCARDDVAVGLLDDILKEVQECRERECGPITRGRGRGVVEWETSRGHVIPFESGALVGRVSMGVDGARSFRAHAEVAGEATARPTKAGPLLLSHPIEILNGYP